VSLNL